SMSAVGVQEGRQDADRGGLARAVRPQQPDDRAFGGDEVDALQRAKRAESLLEAFDDDAAIGHVDRNYWARRDTAGAIDDVGEIAGAQAVWVRSPRADALRCALTTGYR